MCLRPPIHTISRGMFPNGAGLSPRCQCQSLAGKSTLRKQYKGYFPSIITSKLSVCFARGSIWAFVCVTEINHVLVSFGSMTNCLSATSWSLKSGRLSTISLLFHVIGDRYLIVSPNIIQTIHLAILLVYYFSIFSLD